MPEIEHPLSADVEVYALHFWIIAENLQGDGAVISDRFQGIDGMFPINGSHPQRHMIIGTGAVV